MKRRTIVAIVLSAMIGAGLVAALWFAVARRGPESIPEPPVPLDLAQLDPPVAELITQTRRRVTQAPSDARAWATLGMVYHANGLAQLALESYQEAIRLQPTEPRWHYHRALALAMGENLDEAIVEMRRVIELKDDFAPAHWRLGLWLLDSGRLDEAAQCFRDAMRADPADPVGEIGLAQIDLRQRRDEEALAILQRHVRLRPDDQYLHYLLGTAYRQLGRMEEARVELARATGAKRRWDDAWSSEMSRFQAGFNPRLMMASFALAAGQSGQAIKDLEALRVQQPDDPALLNNLALAYLGVERVDDCISVLTGALKLNEEFYATHMNLARALAVKGNASEALAHADRAIQLKPDLGATYGTKGTVLRRLNRPEDAVAAFRQSLALDARSAAVWTELGMTQCQLMKWDDGAASFKRATEVDPSNGDAFLYLSMCQAQVQKTSEAAASLRHAQELGVKNKQLLTALQQQLGQAGPAQQKPPSGGGD